MKNIHLLPTDKPSRLYKSKITQNISMGPIDISQHGDATYNLIIYITSDEEIKTGDKSLLIIDGFKPMILTHHEPVEDGYLGKKIILTTDQDLIADWVQAISDEFLEWFVRNPSCEEVEVKHFGTCCGNQSITQCINCKKYNPVYKIIIPQEEPKQETLEEYSNGLYKQSLKDDVDLTFSDGVKLGAKWQAERMYSEEDLLSAFEAGMMFIGEDKGSFGEWFEQFKKKQHIK
jgi:hypothetical protein